MQGRWVSSPDYKAVIEVLRQARMARSLSQREVARRLGKPVSFINKIELIERRIDIVEFVMLCRALGVKPGDMLEAVVEVLPASPDF